MESGGSTQPTQTERLRALATWVDELLPLAGAVTVVASSLALIGALFLPWYDVPIAFYRDGGSDLDPRPSGWESFSYADVWLACVAATGIGATILAAVLRYRAPFAVSGLAGWIGVAMVIYSFYRPGGLRPGGVPPPAFGYFAALVASGALTGGSLMALMAPAPGPRAAPPP